MEYVWSQDEESCDGSTIELSSDQESYSEGDDPFVARMALDPEDERNDLLYCLEEGLLSEDPEYGPCDYHPAPMSFAVDWVTTEICGRHANAKCDNCGDRGGAWLTVNDSNHMDRVYSYYYMCDKCLLLYADSYDNTCCQYHGDGKQWWFRPRPLFCRTKNARKC